VRAVGVPGLHTLLTENDASAVGVSLAVEEVLARGVASIVLGLGITRAPPVGVDLKSRGE
jgi:hypothetical protein